MSEASVTSAEELNFPFEGARHQRECAIFGMWIFLATEVLFFGGMFAAYLVYRYSYSALFIEAGRHQDWTLGCLNSAILIASGFTMAIAVDFAKRGRRLGLLAGYLVTALLGVGFLAVEAYEYYDKFAKHLFPGRHFHIPAGQPPTIEIFYDLYFVMTGFHALHMTIGLCFIFLFGLWVAGNKQALHKPNCFEVLGLYWAFVDIVWMFLYPLFYLIRPG